MHARILAASLLAFAALPGGASPTNDPNDPTWWDKYQFLMKNGADPNAGPTVSSWVGANVDVSNECGPQSETYIALDPTSPSRLAAGSNEIYRLPMRAYYSSDGGQSWGGVDLPLPPSRGANDYSFGSDPSLVFDTLGNAFYSYIVVYWGNGSGVKGTAMAVARSTDGGRTWPQATFFSYEGGSNHFNDKPMVTADRSPSSPFRDSVYVAWDAATGGSTSGGVRLGRSTDHGQTFTVTRVDDPQGQGRAIGAVPFAGPDGTLYVAWNDWRADAIAVNRSFDGGVTWDVQRVVATKSLPFDIGIPAEFSRGALVYPACDSDRSTGRHRGRIYCAWMDQTPAGTTDILLSYSDDRGATWSSKRSVGDSLGILVDRFNHWLSVDPVTGDVDVSFYDTRNDTTGQRYETDVYLAQSTDGGATFAPNVRVTDVSSNEHDCGGVYPCQGINYGNQQGDYEGLASHGGVSHPVWTDSRRQLDAAAGCRRPYLMEEVFTAAVK